MMAITTFLWLTWVSFGKLKEQVDSRERWSNDLFTVKLEALKFYGKRCLYVDDLKQTFQDY